MSGLFGERNPAPGPAEISKQYRADFLAQREQDRAEKSRIGTIQDQLGRETSFRSQGTGIRSLLGSFGGGRTSLLGSG